MIARKTESPGLAGLAPVLCAILLQACASGIPLTPSDADTVLSQLTLDAPNPAEAGPFRVDHLYYGSGTDKRRPEYRDSVAFRTESVDASRLVSLGEHADERNGYWGFGPKAFPLNGRVWYPAGDGPFPLVLIVHGNHDMKDYSDPGYAYLGRLLASRGMIVTSVDENFLNGSIQEENDARGWMLLEHLQAWRRFDEDPENPFFGKVDLDRVGLIGHSRGGEAVAVAAAFNRLTRYPDDAAETFDFGFGIRAVVAIAPVDGQYLPTGRYTPLEDVNYLVFHGSHDGDVSSFHGLRQYHRISWSGTEDHFKAAVYMYRANHGQWNTVWNDRDNGPRSARVLDLGVLLPGEEQRAFAKLYISAFMEATLHDRREYLPIFRDHRVIGRWLPPTLYITRFQVSSFHALATFEEDIDLTTGSEPGVSLWADSSATWKERRLDLRSRNRSTTSGSQMNQAVWIGWNNRVENTDSVGIPSSYSVSLPPDLAAKWGVDPSWTLDFLVAATHDTPSPRHLDPDSSETVGGKRRATKTEEDEKEPEPIDFSVRVFDADGDSARVEAGRYAPIRYPLSIGILRRKDLESKRFAADHDLVLQSVSVPITDLTAVNPAVDPGRLVRIEFVFDRSEAGTIVLDDIGLSRMPPAFLEAALPRGDG